MTLLAAAQSSAGTDGFDQVYSSDIHVRQAETVIADEDAVRVSVDDPMLVLLGSLPVSADLDALHGLPDGDLLFSLDTHVTLGDEVYRACDIIRFDGVNWSKELDCIAVGLPVGSDIDAVAESLGNVYFSIDIDAELDGIMFSDSDIMFFDGNAFNKFAEASSMGIGVSLDIDALHIGSEGQLLISFDTGGEVGGIGFRDEDIMSWNAPNWSLEFDGSAQLPALVQADIDAWSFIVIDADLIFKDGFE